MREVVIASAVRTPIGSYLGTFANVSAIDLGARVIEEAINRAGLAKEEVQEVLMGNVLQAGLGQGPARQAAMKAGLAQEVPATTINKLCGSGLKAVMMAAQAIKAEDYDVIVAGGMENMSQAPYLLPNARTGYRMGNGEIIDSMILDGLSCAFNDCHMGITAENIADKFSISREEQDQFAALSQNRAEAAIKAGRFKDEIVDVFVPQRKGEPLVVNEDEYPRPGVTAEGLSKLRPAFKKEGTVTAGNASGINDGAAALVVCSLEAANRLGLQPLVKIRSYASAGVDPAYMGLGPIPASRLALQKAGLSIAEIDLIEANEAFSSQALAVLRELGVDPEKVNVNGGAIALGHPIGASGARVLVTLIHEMIKRESRLGLATLCIGGGQGVAMVIENLR